MPTPKITVVTVTRNAAPTLQATIDSVLAQDYPGIECIVVDGASDDGTLEIIKGNAAHLAHWVSEPDGGIYDAMNKGVAKATGDWVLFLNADDELHDARTISSVFAGNGAAWEGRKVVYGHSIMRPDHGRQRLRRAKPLRTIHFKMPFIHQGVFVAAELLRERPFDTRFRIAADYDFFRDVYGRYGPAAFAERDVCVNYFRVGGLSYQQIGRKHSEFLQIIRRYEQGWWRPYCLFLFTARCIVPERLKSWLGLPAA